MVLDSSALIAIIEGEKERSAFIQMLSASATRLVGAPTMLEASMVVLTRKGEERLQDLRDFCAEAEIETVPFTTEHFELAIDAFRRFGKGRDRAGLNFGDCCAYARAKATGEPLLFKGDDFAKTDIDSAA